MIIERNSENCMQRLLDSLTMSYAGGGKIPQSEQNRSCYVLEKREILFEKGGEKQKSVWQFIFLLHALVSN